MTAVIEHAPSRPGGLRAELFPSLALALATLFWAGNFVAGRALRDWIDPLALNFLRWTIALALIVPFVWRSMAAALPVLRREWRLILALGATGIATFHVLVYLALQSTTVVNALLVLSLAPILTLLGSAWLREERPTARQVGGAAISIAGALVLVTRGNLESVASRGLQSGDAWMLMAVVIWAAYSLLLRRRPPELPPSVTLAASIAAALVMMAPLLLIDLALTAPALMLPSLDVLLSIGYISIFASAIAFLLWSRGVSRVGPVRAGQFIHLMPIFGGAMAFVLLGEKPGHVQVAGALLVLAGIAFVERRPPGSAMRNRPPGNCRATITLQGGEDE
jgi:drug/metabolite transporter (DMT)-like permease